MRPAKRLPLHRSDAMQISDKNQLGQLDRMLRPNLRIMLIRAVPRVQERACYCHPTERAGRFDAAWRRVASDVSRSIAVAVASGRLIAS
jgi:hypothetical protein